MKMSAVRFHCTNCQLPIVMGRKFWGKKVKCRQCGTVLTVPVSIHQQESGGQDEESPNNVGRTQTPSWKLGKISATILALAVIAIGALVIALVPRHSWESDHATELTAQIEQADALLLAGEKQQADIAYEQVIAEIGDHEIVDKVLAQKVIHSRQLVAEFKVEQENERIAEEKRKQDLVRQQAEVQRQQVEAQRQKELIAQEEARKIEAARQASLAEARKSAETAPQRQSSVTSKYDRFNDNTSLEVGMVKFKEPFKVGSGEPARFFSLRISFAFSGQVLKNQPKSVSLTVGDSEVGEVTGLGPPYSVIFLADGARVGLRSLHSSANISSFEMATDQLKVLAKADKVEMQIDTYEFVLTESERVIFTDLLTAITPK